MKLPRSLKIACLVCAAMLSAATGGTQPVTTIAAGDFHTLYLEAGGSLWGVGYNNDGQLGNGTNVSTNTPQKILPGGVTAIAGGYYHTLFLKSDGSLWGMGDNVQGQLGDGTSGQYNQTNVPEQIVASNVTAIAAGSAHCLFLKSDGSLWGMGDNGSGELGTGNYVSTNRPEQILPGNVTAIAAGFTDSVFLKADGSLWIMGVNQYGELGNGTTVLATNTPQLIVPGTPGYNQISGQLLHGGTVKLSFVGSAGAHYALDRSFNLAPPNWLPQATNPADEFGALVFTNTPVATTNNFWRIRAVP